MYLELLLDINTTSANQSSIESLLNITNPSTLIYVVCLVIIGPLVEELVFRKAIFNIVPNKKIAAIISCLLFGLLHTIDYDYSTLELIVITLPYFFAGVAFSYVYIKTDNIVTSYILHAFLNLLAVILIL